jgi:hypothetical protein
MEPENKKSKICQICIHCATNEVEYSSVCGNCQDNWLKSQLCGMKPHFEIIKDESGQVLIKYNQEEYDKYIRSLMLTTCGATFR